MIDVFHTIPSFFVLISVRIFNKFLITKAGSIDSIRNEFIICIISFSFSFFLAHQKEKWLNAAVKFELTACRHCERIRYVGLLLWIDIGCQWRIFTVPTTRKERRQIPPFLREKKKEFPTISPSQLMLFYNYCSCCSHCYFFYFLHSPLIWNIFLFASWQQKWNQNKNVRKLPYGETSREMSYPCAAFTYFLIPLTVVIRQPLSSNFYGTLKHFSRIKCNKHSFTVITFKISSNFVFVPLKRFQERKFWFHGK